MTRATQVFLPTTLAYKYWGTVYMSVKNKMLATVILAFLGVQICLALNGKQTAINLSIVINIMVIVEFRDDTCKYTTYNSYEYM